MILKDLLKSQKSAFKNFKNENKDIWDMVIYGSVIRGKDDAKDVDIAIILSQRVSLSVKLDISQKLRQALKFKNLKFDVKAIDFQDLQDANFLARQGIIGEGFSVLKNKFLSESFGFKQYSLFVYSLKNLSPSKKRVFSYALTGRYGSKGLKKARYIEQIGRGVLKVPIQHTIEIENLFRSYTINYKIISILAPSF